MTLLVFDAKLAVDGWDGLGELAEVEIEPDDDKFPLLVQEFSLLDWFSGRWGGECWIWITGDGKSSIGEFEGWAIGGGTEEAVITEGGGKVLPPLEELFIEPFLDSQDIESIADIVTAGDKCLEVEPVNPEAAILDLSDFGWDLAGCEAIDAHVVVFLEPDPVRISIYIKIHVN